MTPEREQALRAAHAAFFDHPDAPRAVACGDGWYPLVDGLLARLAPLLAETGALTNPPRLYEIGAEHGRLRVVLRPMTPEMATLVYETRDRSKLVCETCGELKPPGPCPRCPSAAV